MSMIHFLSLDSAASWIPVADIIVKATLMFVAAGTATFILRRGSAAVRHMIWMLALAGVVLLPILSVALPRWQMPLVKFETAAPVSSFQLPVSGSAIRGERPVTSTQIESQISDHASRDREDPAASHQQRVASSEQPIASRESQVATPQRASWPAILLTVWIAGALLILARLAAGIVAVW